jgi:hypothetical protein
MTDDRDTLRAIIAAERAERRLLIAVDSTTANNGAILIKTYPKYKATINLTVVIHQRRFL